MDYSWRPKTVRNYRITDRNEIPDGQPSGMCRQDFIVRKDHLSWRLADRKVFLTGAPDGLWEGGSGWIPDGYPSGTVVLTVRKSAMSSKKNYTCGTTYIKFSLYASSIYMSIIYIYQTVIHQAIGLERIFDYHIYNFSDLQVLVYIQLMSSLQKLHTDQYNTRSRKLKFSSPLKLNKSSISASLSTSELGLSWKEEFQKSHK